MFHVGVKEVTEELQKERIDRVEAINQRTNLYSSISNWR